MSLRDQKPGQQLSARQLRQAGQDIDRSRPAPVTGGPLAPVSTAGGAGWLDHSPDLFWATIDAIDDGYDPVRYFFTEQWPATGDGDWEDRPSGRVTTAAPNYAVKLTDSAAVVVGDVVLMRRHSRDPDLFEIIITGGGAAGMYVLLTNACFYDSADEGCGTPRAGSCPIAYSGYAVRKRAEADDGCPDWTLVVPLVRFGVGGGAGCNRLFHMNNQKLATVPGWGDPNCSADEATLLGSPGVVNDWSVHWCTRDPHTPTIWWIATPPVHGLFRYTGTGAVWKYRVKDQQAGVYRDDREVRVELPT
jgi:hypothetical protein